jgi:hypothetical protein
MYYKVSIKTIIIVIVAAAILTLFLSSVLHLSYAQTNQDLANEILAVHNRERTAVGVSPLTWNDNLAADAQTWAQHIASTGQFIHDPVHTGLSCTGPCYGENLAGFITGVSEPNGGQSMWVNEKSNYSGGPYNSPYPPGCTPLVDCKVVGHYTQMVWQHTREVGCATAPPGAGGLHYSVLVCRYNPPGNYPGQYPYPPSRR